MSKNLYYAHDVKNEMNKAMLNEIYKIVFTEDEGEKRITPIEKLIAIQAIFLFSIAMEKRLPEYDNEEEEAGK